PLPGIKRYPAIDADYLAVDKAAMGTGEEGDGIGDLGRLGIAVERLLRGVHPLRIELPRRLEARRLRRTGADAIDADAVIEELLGEAASPMHDRRLQGGVDRLRRATHVSGGRGDVDDGAVAALAHRQDEGLGDQHRADQVVVDLRLEVLERNLE